MWLPREIPLASFWIDLNIVALRTKCNRAPFFLCPPGRGLVLCTHRSCSEEFLRILPKAAPNIEARTGCQRFKTRNPALKTSGTHSRDSYQKAKIQKQWVSNHESLLTWNPMTCTNRSVRRCGACLRWWIATMSFTSFSGDLMPFSWTLEKHHFVSGKGNPKNHWTGLSLCSPL